jgi:DNA gyrase/topoisomerase IV subunit A
MEASVITPEKIDEWIREAEERSSSSSLIIRFIGNRLIDLTKWNEELQAENLALRTEKKVEEYESRIATLEYQIDLLKRQLGGEIQFQDQNLQFSPPEYIGEKSINLILYNPLGQVMRFGKLITDLESGGCIGQIIGDVSSAASPIRMLAVHESEELLFAFDSGRTVTMPVTNIPLASYDTLDWQQSYFQPPLGTEELAFIRPIARMALYDACIQVSRKGCVKKIKEALFESYLLKSYIGTGIRSSPDKTCELVLAMDKSLLLLVSKEGFIVCIEMDPLPTTIEEVVRLNITDHIITAFTAPMGNTPTLSLLFVTQNGKVIQRQLDWLDVAGSYKTRGQSVFSQERRDAGIRLAGAVMANEEDWGIILQSDGKLICHQVRDLIRTGTLLRGEPDITILGFTTFHSRN